MAMKKHLEAHSVVLHFVGGDQVVVLFAQGSIKIGRLRKTSMLIYGLHTNEK